jgi:hypothetical protein
VGGRLRFIKLKIGMGMYRKLKDAINMQQVVKYWCQFEDNKPCNHSDGCPYYYDYGEYWEDGCVCPDDD